MGKIRILMVLGVALVLVSGAGAVFAEPSVSPSDFRAAEEALRDENVYGEDIRKLIETDPRLGELYDGMKDSEATTVEQLVELEKQAELLKADDAAQLEIDSLLEGNPELRQDYEDLARDERPSDIVDALREDNEKIKKLNAELEEAKKRDTVLPDTSLSVAECNDLLIKVANFGDGERKSVFSGEQAEKRDSLDQSGVTGGRILACGIKTGNIKLWMVPYFIRFVLEFLIGIAGLIAVGGFVYGGFIYLFAGLSEDKDKGKKALFYSAAGFIMVMVAWAVVNIVIAVVTA